MLKEKMLMLSRKFSQDATIIEQMLSLVIKAMAEKPSEAFFKEMTDLEEKVNQYQVEIDFYCTSIISLYAPEARDLRTVLMILKMNNEMERVGDMLNGIAKALRALEDAAPDAHQKDITELLRIAGKMFKDAIDSFLTDDAQKAHSLLKQDSFIDAERTRIIQLQLEGMAKEPKQVEKLFYLIKITQKIERIADHATNLAEDIIYIIEGKDVKAQN